jgi:hypothetical protein
MDKETLKVIIPILTFLAGLLFSAYIGRKQKISINRAFPSVDEVYATIDPSMLKVKDNTRLYLIGDYEEIRKLDPKAVIIYVKVTNLGPGHMINCNYTINVMTTDKKSNWEFTGHIPLISKDEYLFIPVVNKEMNSRTVILKKVSIEYMTQAREKMIYEQTLQYIDDDNIKIEEELCVKKFIFDERLYSYEGKNSTFLYLVNDNSKKE